MKLNSTLVSIITVVYNSEEYLERTILSVINQSYLNYEYIIIDGGSTDNTLQIIAQYRDKITHWISESDRGIYDAMNKGIRLATGSIIGIINSGDTYTQDALLNIVQTYEKYPRQSPLIITGDMYRFDQEKNLNFRQHRSQIGLEQNINMTIPINHPATFVSKEVYQIIGLFNPNYQICGDYDLIFRAYHHPQVKFVFLNEIIASMMMGGVSDSFRSLWQRTLEKVQIRNNKISLLKNIWLSLKFLITGIIKHTLTLIVGKQVIYLNYLVKSQLKKI